MKYSLNIIVNTQKDEYDHRVETDSVDATVQRVFDIYPKCTSMLIILCPMPSAIGPIESDTLIVFGNWGKLTCNALTGMVLSYDRSESDSDCTTDGYHDIVRVDIDKFRQQHGHQSEIDIVCIGYWTKAGKYEPSVDDLTPQLEPVLDESGQSAGFESVSCPLKAETNGQRLSRLYPEHYVRIVTLATKEAGGTVAAEWLSKINYLGHALACAFDWESTTEGREFWNELSKREKQ